MKPIRALGVALAVATGSAGAAAHAGPADEDLTGVWAFETQLGPAFPDELVVERDGGHWRGRLGGARAAAGGEGIRLSFPGAVGRFQGRLRGDGAAIDGFWVQPATRWGYGFATPVVLTGSAAGGWRGVVKPFAARFRLYLRVFHTDKDGLVGAFRDPERRLTGGAGQYRVTREGDAVYFTARPDPARPEIRHTAALVRGPDRLRIHWPPLDRTIELTRATPRQLAGAFPRPPGGAGYEYRRPEATDDGWTTARAAAVGIDEGALARLVQRLSEADPFAGRPALIHSLLVAHGGKLVLEEYFFGFDRDTTHDIRSAGKTYASVMLGAAMSKGAKLAPDTKVYELLAGMGPFARADPRKMKVTLAHLMTHTSGLACNDYDDDSPGNEDTLQGQSAQPDWWKYALDLPLAHEPGTRYAYCSAGTNLVGGALTAVTGTWLPELFDASVARPLQFGTYHWNLMPTEEGYLGGGAHLRPRDLLKVGQAYLGGGVWNGRRIVDAAWVSRSTSAQLRVSPVTTGLTPEEFRNSYAEADEGLAWHLSGVRSATRAHFAYVASGNGGQLLIVVPELDLAVVFTGGNYGQGGIWSRWADEIVGGEIIPAIRP